MGDSHVWSRFDQGNIASQTLARKLGMRRDRMMERAGPEAGEGGCVFKVRRGLLR